MISKGESNLDELFIENNIGRFGVFSRILDASVDNINLIK